MAKGPMRKNPPKTDTPQESAADPAALLAELRSSQAAVANDVAAFKDSVSGLGNTLTTLSNTLGDAKTAKTNLDDAITRGGDLLTSILAALGISSTADNPAFQATERIMPTKD